VFTTPAVRLSDWPAVKTGWFAAASRLGRSLAPPKARPTGGFGGAQSRHGSALKLEATASVAVSTTCTVRASSPVAT
jgi:hypothetical protein